MGGGPNRAQGQWAASFGSAEFSKSLPQWVAGLGLGLVLGLWPGVLWGQTPEPDLTAADSQVDVEEIQEEVPFEGDIGLDQLLQLPSNTVYGGEARQGSSPQTWRRRFAEAAEAVTQARDRIDKARAALDEMSAGGGSSQWQMAPPGQSASSEVAPMSLKQREEIRAGKQELDEAERAQRALVIEADLAGVPKSWRVPVKAEN